MLGSLILYLKGMRLMMFQLSGFYYKGPEFDLFPGELGQHELGLLVQAEGEDLEPGLTRAVWGV